jgi:hypothetical protein
MRLEVIEKVSRKQHVVRIQECDELALETIERPQRGAEMSQISGQLVNRELPIASAIAAALPSLDPLSITRHSKF